MILSRLHKPSRIILVMFALAGLSAFVLLFIITPYGPGLRDDSYTYLSAAEYLTTNWQYARPSAVGESAPISNFPPAYSILLAIPILIGADPITSARIVNAILFAALIISSGYLVYLISRRTILTIVAVSILISSSELVQQFTWAQSEPLFLSLIPLGFLLLFELIHSKGQTKYLIASSTIFALTFLTRYAGVSFILSASLLLLFIPYEKLKKRFTQSILFACIASIPTALFLARNLIRTGNLTNRPPPFWHPPEVQTWIEGGRGILMWFLPDRLVLSFGNGIIVTIVVILFTVLMLSCRWAHRMFGGAHVEENSHNASLMIRICFTHLFFYGIFIITTVTFLDILTPLNDRILSPIYLLILFEIVLIVSLTSQRYRTVGATIGYLALLLVVGLKVYRISPLINDLQSDGQGYTQATWRDSETLDSACAIPEVPIYSNDLPAFYFHCQRIVRPLPSATNFASNSINPEYQKEMQDMRVDLQSKNGYLVILGWYGEERIKRLGLSSIMEDLRIVSSYDDGLILSY